MDRIRVQIQFRRFLWTCPKCKKEDYEDRDMAGGQSYEHTCSACAAKFNQTHMKEYNGCITYTPEEYEVIKEQDVAEKKQALVDKWVYDVKNPPPYVEPSREDLEKMLADKQAEVSELQTQISAKEVK